ncbi:MAG: YciI family protein [Xanthobacteraceae bacterium]|nr:YciI family protein [Xanthobacteraceae bacterium]MBX3522216.1 YciI family protein [Xanthobacteraceae bacterium]MCW5674512.1 YciI family protein [Xanthobacteraceae bacterium]
MSEQLFLVIAHDKQGAEDLRAQHRDAHVAYLKKSHGGVQIDVGGPLTADEKNSAGTFLIVRAADRMSVEQFVAGDPFAAAGIFGSVDIKPCKVTLRS